MIKSKINNGKGWDKRSIIIFIILIFILAGSILFSTIDFKYLFVRNNSNWSTITGRIDSIEELTGINQTRTGNKTSIKGYKVCYTYIVKKKEYHAEVVISPSKREFVSFADKTKNRWEIEIYYNKSELTDSYMNTDMKSTFYRQKNASTSIIRSLQRF